MNVLCPVCKGSKTTSYGTDTCLCCKGVGTISKERDELLAKIRKDLNHRLIERGADVHNLYH